MDKIPFCSSFKCSGGSYVNSTKTVQKSVSKGTYTCPDCGHGLEWKAPKKMRKVKDRLPKKIDYSLN